MSIVSYKIPIEEIKEPVILDFFRQFNNVKRRAHSLLKTNQYSDTQILEILKQMNNIDLIDTASMEYARTSAKKNPQEDAIFGSKAIFEKLKFKEGDREENLQEWNDQRNQSVFLVGRASDPYGNRKIKLIPDENKFIFKINKQNNFEINFLDLNNKDRGLLNQLKLKGEAKVGKWKKGEIPISYTLSRNHLVVHVDASYIITADKTHKPIKNRILSMDLNPNCIGYVVKENDKLIHKEIINLFQLTGKNSNHNKLIHEIYEIAQYLINKALHYRCELVAFEDLNIKSKDNKKGKNYNRTVNNKWPRRKFINNFKKWLDVYNISYKEISAPYSSLVGQILNPNEFDMIAAATKIDRRARELVKRNYNYWFPKIEKEQLPTRWKEMVVGQSIGWIQFHKFVTKEKKLSYRNLLPWKTFKEGIHGFSSSLFSKKSGVRLVVPI